MEESIRSKIHAILRELQNIKGWNAGIQNPMMAELHYLIAEEQSKSAERVEKQTSKLIHLTWALVGLTIALLVLTAVLYKDSHQLVEREKAMQQRPVSKP